EAAEQLVLRVVAARAAVDLLADVDEHDGRQRLVHHRHERALRDRRSWAAARGEARALRLGHPLPIEAGAESETDHQSDQHQQGRAQVVPTRRDPARTVVHCFAPPAGRPAPRRLAAEAGADRIFPGTYWGSKLADSFLDRFGLSERRKIRSSSLLS